MLINIAERAYAEVERIFRVILPESGLTVREEQITLCHSMLDSLLHNTISLCDAGVGIGKTYAYLVACILARKYSIQLSRPLVISTSSVALQEAILGEYLPFLSKVLLSNSVIDELLTAYLRKGKERFVCDERLSQRLKAVVGTKKNAKQLAALRSLMLRYDLDTVTGLSEFDRRQVCVPKACPKSCARKDTCRYHVYLHQAQSGPDMIQICNHNYLLADAEHRRQGFHPLLKGYGILVVDEAHKLWDAACQMYGEILSSQDFEELSNLLEKEKCSQVVYTLREKSAHFAAAFRQVETREDERCRLPLILTSIRSKVLMNCENSFSQIKRTLPEKAPRWLVHRLEKMERTTRLFREQDSKYIRYLKYDRDGTPFLCAVNKDIPKQLRRALWEQRIPVILTSGTLKAGNDFHPVMEKTGLDSLPNVRTYGDDRNPLIEKSQFILSLFEQLAGAEGISAKEKSILDRCTYAVYRDYIARGYQGDVPTLKDLYLMLLKQPEPEAHGLALSAELFITGSLNTFAQPTNVNTNARIISYDIRELGEQLMPIGMLVTLDAIFNRVIQNWKRGKTTWVFADEFYLLFRYPYSGDFFYRLWKRIRKYNGLVTGLTQNVEELLHSETARMMLANSEFLVMLNQSSTDRAELAKLLHISDTQLGYITNVAAGCGLIRCAGNIVPFENSFPRNTQLYKLMTTKPGEAIRAM